MNALGMDYLRSRKRIERAFASKVKSRVLRWFGHMESMIEGSMDGSC